VRHQLPAGPGGGSTKEEKGMKRLHVHVAVENVRASIRFYSALFAAEPVVLKDDYAKWMLEDPRVNFAISHRGEGSGIRHLGIQVEDPQELAEVYSRLKSVDRSVLEEGATTCCYARSEKSWIEDPQGIKWETFLTVGEATTYGSDEPSMPRSAACCEPAAVAPTAAPSKCCA
jgi:catechol 2,3-dioxygenase-like lactoylglutathione lyase family enzyme